MASRSAQSPATSIWVRVQHVNASSVMVSVDSVWGYLFLKVYIFAPATAAQVAATQITPAADSTEFGTNIDNLLSMSTSEWL
ncbi:hypothetical protein KFU94_59855 [Chloroflexi bacterium TSY]|nr:hypothetical protein [Chloroflexi bacterium TSY]